jgi:hypothetical protein
VSIVDPFAGGRSEPDAALGMWHEYRRETRTAQIAPFGLEMPGGIAYNREARKEPTGVRARVGSRV